MKRHAYAFAALIAAVGLGACSDDGLTGNGGENRLRLQLTDAPGDLKEVFVKIEKVVLVRSETDTTGDSRIEIRPEITDYVSLLTLSGGKLLDIADTTGLPSGTFTQMRVYLDDAYIRLNDDRVFATAGASLPAGVTSSGTLKCPSCSQSGIKVKFTNGGLTLSENSVAVIDFDAGQSFGHEAGKSGQWIMRPVIRATAKTITFGAIRGNVTLGTGVTIPTCGGQANTITAFKPFAALASDTLSGVVDAAGAYRISNVTPGTYTLGYTADVTFTNGDSLTFVAAPSAATVAVAEADSATANFAVSAVTCH